MDFQSGGVEAQSSMVAPGEGINLWVLGVLVTLKVLGNETGGSYALFEDLVPPELGPPLHSHTLEDESWYLLEGQLSWQLGDSEFLATPGSFIHLPRNVPHTFKNKSGKNARMLATYAPAGFERWFLEVGTQTNSLSVEHSIMARDLMVKYGVNPVVKIPVHSEL